MSTIANTIAVAKVTSYLASNDIAKGKMFPSVIRTEPRFPLMITTERIAIEGIYNRVPAYTNLQLAADYLYDLCGKYRTTAQAIVDGGGGGSVAPVTPSANFPVYVTSSDFTNATDYDNDDLLGNNLVIFINELNQYIFYGTGFTFTSTGIQILVPGFDATQFTYNLIIERVTSG